MITSPPLRGPATAASTGRRCIRVPAEGRSVRALAEAIRRVAAGGRAIIPPWRPRHGLSPTADRSRAPGAAAFGRGLTGELIARQLKLLEGTVRNYLSEAIGKLGAANRIGAARIARQRGWL